MPLKKTPQMFNCTSEILVEITIDRYMARSLLKRVVLPKVRIFEEEDMLFRLYLNKKLFMEIDLEKLIIKTYCEKRSNIFRLSVNSIFNLLNTKCALKIIGGNLYVEKY